MKPEFYYEASNIMLRDYKKWISGEWKGNTIKHGTNAELLLRFGIKKVMFNNPATIVWLNDGSKGVSRCSKHDEYDPYVGMILAVADAKLKGHKMQLKKWCERKASK